MGGRGGSQRVYNNYWPQKHTRKKETIIRGGRIVGGGGGGGEVGVVVKELPCWEGEVVKATRSCLWAQEEKQHESDSGGY